ncbi:MAG: ATP synthase F1 subunit gamma [bacterium]|nr:ATP synthase F1 subunit gamma [bacterium]
MANTRDIKKRIKATGNIGKITKAMEMVSAAKMRKAQEKTRQSRQYAQALSLILSQISTAVSIADIPLPILRRQPVSGRQLIVLIATDKGLCGALNNNLFRYLETYIRQNLKASQIEFVTVGKKAGHFAAVQGYQLVASFHDFHDVPTSDESLAVTRLIIDGFVSQKYDQVFLAYPKFINTLTQVPTIQQILPLTKEELEEFKQKVFVPQALEGFIKEYILFEPDPRQILEEVIPYALEMKLYQALIEASASEHSARMVAMRNAHDNAEDVQKGLRREYNKARQTQVTNEIADIVTATMSLTLK